MKRNFCLFISEKELYLVIILDSDNIASSVCKLFHIGKTLICTYGSNENRKIGCAFLCCYEYISTFILEHLPN